MYEDEYKATIKELNNNNLQYDKLFCDFDKAKICKIEKIDLFIDDTIDNCIKVSKLGIKTLLFNSKANTKVETNLRRVNSWEEIYNLII